MGRPSFMQESVIADWTVGTTGATAASGAIVDMSGYESVLFLGHVETTQAQAHLSFEMGTATDAMEEATGDAPGVAPSLYLDVFRPARRFVRGVCGASAGGQNLEVITILYGARSQPTSNSTLVNGTILQSPASGAAST